MDILWRLQQEMRLCDSRICLGVLKWLSMCQKWNLSHLLVYLEFIENSKTIKEVSSRDGFTIAVIVILNSFLLVLCNYYKFKKLSFNFFSLNQSLFSSSYCDCFNSSSKLSILFFGPRAQDLKLCLENFFFFQLRSKMLCTSYCVPIAAMASPTFLNHCFIK